MPKDIVFRLQATYFSKELPYQLNVMLCQIPIVCRQQSIHLVKKYNCGTMFFCACKDSGHALERIPDATSENICCSKRVKATLGLAFDQASN